MAKKFTLKTGSTSAKTPNKKWWILGGIVAVILLICILELTDVTHFFHEKKAVSSTITKASSAPPSSSSSSDQADDSTATPSQTPSNPGSTKDTSPTADPNAPLTAPYGTFVSNHRVSKESGTSEDSVCLTTPGASCTITFTKDDAVKTLAAGTADSNGAVFWNKWDVKQAGLTNGSWTINATATLGGQSKSTKDSLTLEVDL
jgi:hypothetical protein